MIIYISKAFETNIGATQHYHSIKEIFGENNVFTIDLRAGKPFAKENYIAFGKYKNKLERIKRWFQGNMMFISNGIINKICAIIEDKHIDKVFIEDSVLGNLVKKIKRRFPEVKVFSFYHDIKADLYKQWKKKGNLVSKIEYRIGLEQEKKNQMYCDYNLVFNQRDADLFYKYYGRYPEHKLALSASIPYLEEKDKLAVSGENETKHLFFVGKNYYPNLVGLRWFYSNVLPKLGQNICIDIVGRGLEFLKTEFTDERVNVIGAVEDLGYYYKNTDIVIAPLFDGGGMKSKTVEAFSFGKVFIGTDESLFGFWEKVPDELRNQIVYKCNTDKEWADIINNLSHKSVCKFNNYLFQVFTEEFSYEAIREQLKKIMTD